MAANWRDRIVSKPEVLHGKPCIAGTRIPASLVLGYLALGRGFPEIRKELPDLADADIAACLDFARDLAGYEVAVS